MEETDARVVEAIRPMGVAGLLAAELRRRLLSGELPDGSSLPSERLLSEQSGLGRSSVREALRILEAEGLISVDRGRGRGITVRRPGAETLSRSIGLVVASDESQADLVEFRRVLEPVCAGLAAVRRSADDIAAMQQCNEKMGHCISQSERGRDMRKELIQINTRWHMDVASATGNTVIAYMMTAIQSVLTSAVAAEFETHVYGDDSIWKITLASHQAVTAAIIQGDEETAVRRMARHVQAYAQTVEAAQARKQPSE